MPLELKWVGPEALDDLVAARTEAYEDGASAAANVREQTLADDRAAAGDYLLAYEGPRPVGTATSLSMQMSIRGAALPCQGIAWLGTARTHRRASGRFGGKGIASQLMEAAIQRGRERGDVVSALMPFRGSFYEEFGYGVVERRVEWTIPMRTFPVGATGGLRLFEPNDAPELAACLGRAVAAGQCDLARSPGRWAATITQWSDGWTIVDRPTADGPIRGYMHLATRGIDPHRQAIVREQVYQDTPTLVRQLRFLASLRDQYAGAVLTLSSDLPLNLLLREPQVLLESSSGQGPATVRTYNRMMLRVLDHKRLLEAMTWPSWAKGRTTIGIQESEGKLTRITIDVADGRAAVTVGATAMPEAAISDNTWAQIAVGELVATRAVAMGLIAVETQGCLQILDALKKGPSPFCHEDF
jgi:predicted acetyltransferase